MIDNLKVKKYFVIDDQSAYWKGIADVVVPKLKDAGVDVSSDSVSQNNTDYSALVSKISDDTDVVFLPWMLAANAQLFGDQMAEQGKKAAIFGSDGVFSPQDFHVDGLPFDVFAGYSERREVRRPREGVRGSVRTVRRLRTPTYPATQVVLEAIKKACDDGDSPPDVAAVADNVKNTNIESVLGQPIQFESNGEMKDGSSTCTRSKTANT